MLKTKKGDSEIQVVLPAGGHINHVHKGIYSDRCDLIDKPTSLKEKQSYQKQVDFYSLLEFE